MPVRIFCVLLLAALTTGCGSGSTPPTQTQAPTVFDPLLQQRDRAQAQATEMEHRKQQLDGALESQER
jgi:hypothetical protein